jgi:hypothetical protein
MSDTEDLPGTKKPVDNEKNVFDEVYPEIYDPELESSGGGYVESTHPRNVQAKRLYLAVREVLRRDFCPNDDGVPANPSDFKNAPINQRIRFVSVLGELLLRGFKDPSLGRLAPGASDKDGSPSHGHDYAPASGHDTDLFRSFSHEARLKTPDLSQTDVLEAYRELFGSEPPDPSSRHEGGPGPFSVIIARAFADAVGDAVKSFNRSRDIYRQSYYEVRKRAHGKTNNGPGKQRRISAKLVAAVAERLVIDRVDPNEPLFVQQVANAIATAVGGGGIGGTGPGGVNPSARELIVPDLDAGAGAAVEIIPDNVQAIRFIYFSAQLEEMKLHAVHDKVVEHFQTGMLPISRGPAADKLHVWMKRSADRISEAERRALYGRVLGLAQGGIDVLPNREFIGLWTRFLSTVSQKAREIASTERARVSAEQIHKCARDLAVNLSLHGYGWASPAATEMMDVVNDMFSILDEPQVMQAYGVRDRWQLVDRVSSLYLGGASNGVRYRATAQSGQLIIDWLAKNAAILASGSVRGLQFIEHRGRGRVRPTEMFETLAEWCERWLAATGIADSTAEQHIDPVDLPTQYTVPMLGQHTNGMPQAVQDALDQVGAGHLPSLPVIPQA